jgi:hypothetical protein
VYKKNFYSFLLLFLKHSKDLCSNSGQSKEKEKRERKEYLLLDTQEVRTERLLFFLFFNSLEFR